MIVAVTAFVPIPGHPRSEEEYHELGHELKFSDIPLIVLPGVMEECWLFRYLRWRKRSFTHSVADNPDKNSVAYHIVVAQKTEWLTDAAHRIPEADVLVWIDYGIFHIPGVTPEIIQAFMEKAKDERAVAIPGCWDSSYHYDDRFPCWRFCGGVMVVPRQHVFAFDLAMKTEYIRWLRATDNLSWEVNTLARLERSCTGIPIWHYKADHDATIFTAYESSAGRSVLVH